MSDSLLEELDYELPPERIAQQPVEQRDAARLLVLERSGDGLQHGRVRDLARWLRPGDLLVRNVSRVLPARLRGEKDTGGAVEALLLGLAGEDPRHHRALLRSGGRQKAGQKLLFAGGLEAEISEVGDDGEIVLAFAAGTDPHAHGEMPLPPYIQRDAAEPADAERYQTVYARELGSVAAPTAGLHFTTELLEALGHSGVEVADVVLHVGPGTFRPLREEELERDELHAERYELSDATAAAVARTRQREGRVVAIGTTSARVLESCAISGGAVQPGEGETGLLLRPGSPFRVVDGLLTNFHLPGSSLLLLVHAFAGRERIRAAYAEAIARSYRFYSYGDAMLIL